MTVVFRAKELALLNATLLEHSCCGIQGITGVGKSALAGAWLEQLPTPKALTLSLRGARSSAQALDALAQALELKRSTEAPWQPGVIMDVIGARAITHIIIDDVSLEALELATLLEAFESRALECKLVIITSLAGLMPAPYPIINVAPWECGSWDAPATQALRSLMGPSRQKTWRAHEREQLIELAQRFDGLPAMVTILAKQLRLLSSAELLRRLDEPRFAQRPSFEQALELLREQLEPQSWRALLLSCGALGCTWRDEALEVMLGKDHAACLRPLMDRGIITRSPDSYQIMRALKEVASDHAQRELGPELEQAQLSLEAWLGELGQALYFEGLADAFSPVSEPLLAHAPTLREALARVIAQRPSSQGLAGLLMGMTLVLRRTGRFEELKALISSAKPLLDQHPTVMLRLTFLLIEADLDELAGHEELGYARLKDGELVIEQLSEQAQRLIVLRMLESANHAYDMETGQEMVKRWEQLRLEATPRQRALALTSMGQFFTYGHDYPQAERTLNEAIEAASALNAPDIEAKAQMVLGFTLQYLGKMHLAQQAMTRSMQLYRELGRADALAHALRTQGWLLMDMGRHQHAIPLLVEMVQVGRTYGLSWAIGVGLFIQGQVELDRGQHKLASVCYEQARHHLAMIQDEDHLMALDLYGAINGALEGDLAGAIHALESSLTRQQEKFNRWSRIQTGLSLSALYVKASPSELERAQAELERAKALIPEGNKLLDVQYGIHEAIIGIPLAEQEITHRKLYQAQALLTQLCQQLRAGLDPLDGEDEPIWRQSLEIRLGMRLLWWTISKDQRRRLRFALMDPGHEALLVDQELRAWRAPQDPRWVEMPKRYTPWRLLQALVQTHEDGETLSAKALTALLWPEEATQAEHASSLSEALMGRLYVTINELRREGLGELIVVTEQGYRLASQLRIITEPGYAELASWLD